MSGAATQELTGCSGRGNQPATADDRITLVGAEIRDLRKAKRMTLAGLASITGLSIGHLSEIERDQASPSVKALHDIAKALGVTIGWFFRNDASDPPEERDYVVRAERRRRLSYNAGITDELLSPHLRGQLEMLIARFPPESSGGENSYTHHGEEGGFVLKGMFELWIGGRSFVLREGDSFGFPSTTPHRYRNPGKEEAVVIWAITPPTY